MRMSGGADRATEIERTYRADYGRFLRVAVAIVRDEQLAEEAVHDRFVRRCATGVVSPRGGALEARPAVSSREMRGALVGALAVLLGVGLATLERARASPLAAVSSPSCPATLVRYGVTPEATRSDFPWIAAGPGGRRIVGLLYTHPGMLADSRVRLSSGFVLYAGRRAKIGWLPRSWGGGWGRYLTIEGRRLDGSGTFRERFGRAVTPQFYPTGVKVPTAGCWRLTLRSGLRSVSVVVRAIEPPARTPCDLSAVGPRGIPATPASSGIVAGWHWQTDDGGALMYVGGKTPDGGNTKVLWSVERGYEQTVRLFGDRLDGDGTFGATLSAVDVPGAFPSTVVVPSPGCWLLTVRTGSLGGVIVFRAVSL